MNKWQYLRYRRMRTACELPLRDQELVTVWERTREDGSTEEIEFNHWNLIEPGLKELRDYIYGLYETELSPHRSVRRGRRALSVGESPTRQHSLQPVAIGAVVEVNEAAEAFGVKGHFSGSASTQAVTSSERRAGLEKGNAEADPPEFRGRPPPLGKRARRAPGGSAGVVATACMHMGERRNTGSPRRRRGVRANRQPARARPGRLGWREARSTGEAG